MGEVADGFVFRPMVGSGRGRSRENGLLLVDVGVGVGFGFGFRGRGDARWCVRLVFGIAGGLAVARLNGAGRGAGHGGILSACRADRLADQPREEGSEEVEGHP